MLIKRLHKGYKYKYGTITFVAAIAVATIIEHNTSHYRVVSEVVHFCVNANSCFVLVYWQWSGSINILVLYTWTHFN